MAEPNTDRIKHLNYNELNKNNHVIQSTNLKSLLVLKYAATKISAWSVNIGLTPIFFSFLSLNIHYLIL